MEEKECSAMEVFLQLLESTVVKEGLCVVSSINTLACSASCKSTALENRATGGKDQRPSSNSGPTLYRGISATRATDPGQDLSSTIAF